MQRRSREAVFLTGLFALLGFCYAFVRINTSCRREAIETDIITKRQAIAEFQESAAGVEAMELQLVEVRKSVADFQHHMPTRDQIDDIIANLSRLAAANSLATQSIRKLEPGQISNFGEQRVELSLSGDFNGVYALLLQIEKLSKLTRVSQLKIEKTDEHDSAVRATITLSIFFVQADKSVAMDDKEQP